MDKIGEWLWPLRFMLHYVILSLIYLIISSLWKVEHDMNKRIWCIFIILLVWMLLFLFHYIMHLIRMRYFIFILFYIILWFFIIIIAFGNVLFLLYFIFISIGTILILYLFIELSWLLYFYLLLLYGGIFIFILYYLYYFNCILSIFMIIGITLNNIYILILCLFSKIGFAPFILIIASIWFCSNYWFLLIDIIIKFGYFICFILLLSTFYYYIYSILLLFYFILSFIYLFYFIKCIYSIKQIIFISSLINYINSTIGLLVSAYYAYLYYVLLSLLSSIFLLISISLYL